MNRQECRTKRIDSICEVTWIPLCARDGSLIKWSRGEGETLSIHVVWTQCALGLTKAGHGRRHRLIILNRGACLSSSEENFPRRYRCVHTYGRTFVRHCPRTKVRVRHTFWSYSYFCMMPKNFCPNFRTQQNISFVYEDQCASDLFDEKTTISSSEWTDLVLLYVVHV